MSVINVASELNTVLAKKGFKNSKKRVDTFLKEKNDYSSGKLLEIEQGLKWWVTSLKNDSKNDLNTGVGLVDAMLNSGSEDYSDEFVLEFLGNIFKK
ncbi:hypothetical protein [Bacillus badius]|uniref:hypothetical protein n=1 Tax=Bacillus badius TaxID=1455 RepID=UPI0007B3C3F3|nr:hypothetical protein [Bacillus badius]KZR56947.1 hypothetical protein A3781_20415 [Bacillus badius]